MVEGSRWIKGGVKRRGEDGARTEVRTVPRDPVTAKKGALTFVTSSL